LYVYMHVASEEMILLQFTTMGIIGRLLKSAMHLQAGASTASTDTFQGLEIMHCNLHFEAQQCDEDKHCFILRRPYMLCA